MPGAGAADVTDPGAVWVDDGSSAVKPGPAPGEFAVEGKASGDAPVNARWSQALAPGAYFEVRVLELGEHCSVGVVTEAGFAAGYRVSGLFFNGNLTDGGGGLKFSFGERPAKGMVLGVCLDLEGDAAIVTFYQDGRCLGAGFRATRKDPGAAIYPMVSTSSDGDRYSIQVFSHAVGDKARQKEKPAGHPAVAKWALRRLSVGPELGEFPLASKMEGNEVTMEVQAGQESGGFHLHFKVANMIKVPAEASKDSSLEPFEALKLHTDVMASTMMMPPPGMNEVERQISESLKCVHKWLAVEGKELLLVGPLCEMSFEPAADEFAPVTETPLP